MSTLKLGTRGSRLAVAQSSWVARRLEALEPGLKVELETLVTRGDRYPGQLAEIGGKGLFTEELEAGLVDGSLDLAVHSLKDMPALLPQELTLVAFPPREDPRDVLISNAASTLGGLPSGAVVLTGSMRRQAQLLRLRPDLHVKPIRGNIDTRIEKWRRGEGQAVILAAAGLHRLELSGFPAHPIPASGDAAMVPAPGQGTLVLQVKRDSAAEQICSRLNDTDAYDSAHAERQISRSFGGDCTLPLGAWGRRLEDGRFALDAILLTPDGQHTARGSGIDADPKVATTTCIQAMRDNGAADILKRIRGGD